MARMTDEEFVQLVAWSWRRSRSLDFDGYSPSRCQRLLPTFYALHATAHYAVKALNEIATRITQENQT